MSKRSGVDEGGMEQQGGGEDATKRIRQEGKIDTRWIIRGVLSGTIIGKGGSTVKAIRQDSGACVSILNKSGEKNADQVMLVRGSTEEITIGIQMIADALVQGSRQEGAETTSLQLLVPSCQVGAIIGKGGTTIQSIISETSCSIQITKDSLGMSTEKGVDISGTPASMGAAINRILLELDQHPIKPGTPQTQYRPGGFMQQQPFPQPGGYSMFDQYQTPFMQSPYGGAPMGMPHGGGRKPRNDNGVIGQSVGGGNEVKLEQKISIPAICSGQVIGKRGATIQAMSKSSGANIIIAPAEGDSPSERIVSVKGTPEAIERAIAMIRQVIEQPHGQQPPQFGVPPGGYGGAPAPYY